MRPLFILLALITAAAAGADDTAVIEWSPQRPLTWSDFLDSVPRTADEIRVAATTASISWSYKYSVAHSSARCTFTITEIGSVAGFHPGSSWVRAEHRNPGVLAHEQGHFDIAQIYREKFIAATRELIGFSDECLGRNKRTAAEDSERRIAEIVGSVYEEIWNQYRSHQEQYDADTVHGSDTAAQARWTEDIHALLSAGP